MQANMDVRNAAKSMGVRLWEVADALRITDGMLSRKLRRELPEVEQEKMLRIIEAIAAERKKEG